MFRFFVAAMVWSLSATAIAYPAIGDKVEWTGFMDHRGEHLPLKVTKEVLNQNQKTGKWIIKKVAVLGDQTTTEVVEEERLFAPEDFKKMLTHCQDNKGKLEKITVPAGTYETCLLTTVQNNGLTLQKWYGDVPFGIVRKNTIEPPRQLQSQVDLKIILQDL